MVNNVENGATQRNLSMIRLAYRRRVRALQRRYNAGKSARSLAVGLRISHPTLLGIFKDPKKEVSRKVMLKVIRRPRSKENKGSAAVCSGGGRRFAVVVGRYAPDAI